MIMLPLATTNYVAVLGAAIVGVIIGMIWYNPAVFGKQWMKAMGKTEKEMEKEKQNMGTGYLVAFVATLLGAFMLSQVVGLLLGKTPIEGAIAGFWVWLGFLMPVAAVAATFGGKKQVFWIDAGHHLVLFAIMGAILAVWV